MNMLKTILLMGLLTALIVAVGAVFGGRTGMVMAFVLAMVTNFASYWFSDKIALSMSGAEPISRREAPELYEIVEGLARKTGLPTPPIYLIPTDSPNAFATGRDPQHAAVAVTAGIMRLLNRKEIEGVLAHELAHVKDRDVLITTMAAVLASVVTMIAHWGMYFGSSDDRDGARINPFFAILLVILAPIAATLINLAISRSREFEADAEGAHICGDPMELASALRKLEEGTQQLPYTDANPALSSMFIIKPNPGSFFTNLFSTHPPTQERIKRLTEMAHLRQ